MQRLMTRIGWWDGWDLLSREASWTSASVSLRLVSFPQFCSVLVLFFWFEGSSKTSIWDELMTGFWDHRFLWAVLTDMFGNGLMEYLLGLIIPPRDRQVDLSASLLLLAWVDIHVGMDWSDWLLKLQFRISVFVWFLLETLLFSYFTLQPCLPGDYLAPV